MRHFFLVFSVLTCGLFGTAASAQSPYWAVFGNNVSSLMGISTLDYAPPGSVNYTNGWRQWSQTYTSQAEAFRTLCRWNWSSYRGATAPDATSGACAAACNGNASCQ